MYALEGRLCKISVCNTFIGHKKLKALEDDTSNKQHSNVPKEIVGNVSRKDRWARLGRKVVCTDGEKVLLSQTIPKEETTFIPHFTPLLLVCLLYFYVPCSTAAFA